MKKLKSTAIMLSALFLFNSSTSIVQAAPPQPELVTEDQQDTTKLPVPEVPDSDRELNYRDINFEVPSFENEPDSLIPAQRATIPSSYSSAKITTGLAANISSMRDYVTPVKEQYSGTCWAQSAISVAESELIKNSSASVQTLDYDEYKLAYFNYNRPLDPLGLTQGDATNITRTGNPVPEYLSSGGNLGVVMTELANWITPSDDGASLDYINSLPTSNQTTYAYHQDAAHLENAYSVAMPNMSSAGYANDMDVVKQLIMDYGSAGISYYAGNYESRDGRYYYCPTSYGTNHAVTVVGWDNSIPASSFTTPAPGNGAWIVKNSWGNYNAMSGYFYLSYYDKSIANVAYIWDFSSNDNYDNNYQYDGSGNFVSYYQLDNQICGANTFVADSNEHLRAVGFYTNNLNVNYTVEIYTGLGAGSVPGSGTMVKKKSGVLTYGGYHTVSLDSPVTIQEGQRYAVVLTLSKNGEKVKMPCDMTTDFGWMSCVSFAAQNQSYIGNSISNLSDLNAGASSYRDGKNLRIKAYTVERTGITGISLNKTTAELKGGATLQLTATVAPAETASQRVNWASSNAAIAEVNASGMVTAKAAGKATITANPVTGGFSASCEVTVKPTSVTGISLGQTSLNMGVSNAVQLKAAVTPSNATNQKVNWSSDNPNVAAVNTAGLITGKAEGTAVISAVTADGSFRAACTVRVYQQNQWYSNADGTFSYYVNGSPVTNAWIVGKDGDSELRYINGNGVMVTNQFIFDGTYTYYMMADGSAMKDRMTYHPDGVHLIYFDEYGHEVFSNFQYSSQLGHIYYFDSQGYLYKDEITFWNGGTYYLNGNGQMEQNGWFAFANGRDYGFANGDGTLMDSGFSYDPWGRVVFYHWNGMVARGLITDGQWYYQMDETDGHLVGQFQ